LLESIVGGIGFPLIYDVIEKRRYRKLKLKYRFTLFSKVVLTAFVVVTAVGLIFNFSFEYAYIGTYHPAMSVDYYPPFLTSPDAYWGHAPGFNKN
jgi:Trk-type K+ transport system membrane component